MKCETFWDISWLKESKQEDNNKRMSFNFCTPEILLYQCGFTCWNKLFSKFYRLWIHIFCKQLAAISF